MSSHAFDAERASWSGLSASETRRLAQLRRLLRAGVGADWHSTEGSARRPRPVLIYEAGDFDGVVVEPARSKPVVVPFAAIETVEMPFASRVGVGSAALAASLSICYAPRPGVAPVAVDLALQSSAVAYMIADGVELARRVALSQAAGPPPISGSPRPGSSVLNGLPPEAHAAFPERRTERNSAALGRATRYVAPLLMDGDAPQRRWWSTLRRGVVVELYYAEDTHRLPERDNSESASGPFERWISLERWCCPLDAYGLVWSQVRRLDAGRRRAAGVDGVSRGPVLPLRRGATNARGPEAGQALVRAPL